VHSLCKVVDLPFLVFVCASVMRLSVIVLLHLIPEFLHKKLRIEASVSENNSLLTCNCERPSFGKLVHCSNVICCVESFIMTVWSYQGSQRTNGTALNVHLNNVYAIKHIPQ